nr:phytase [Kineococcus siccus]
MALLPLSPAAAAPSREPRWATVTATAETPAVFDDEADGNADADDPALWTSRTAPGDSVVVATLKNGGLAAYALDGSLLQRLAVPATPAGAEEASRYNNVDVVQGARIGGRTLDLAVVSDRGRDRVRVFAIDPRGAAAGAAVLRDVTAPGAAPVFSASEAAVDEQETAYGLAAGLDARGGVQVLTTRRHTTDYAVLDLVAGPGGTVGYREVSRSSLPAEFTLSTGGTWSPCEEPGEGPQMEGTVRDPASGAWFVAQEDVGIWRLTVEGGATTSRRLLDTVRGFGVPATYDAGTESCEVSGPDPGVGGTHLTADAEGLTVAPKAGGGTYLFASSQGDSTFAVYDVSRKARYVGGFSVADGPGIDGVQHSDGATLSTSPLGPDFPHGVFVSHDGEETPTVAGADGEARVSTGFTLVPLERITTPLGLRL